MTTAVHPEPIEIQGLLDRAPTGIGDELHRLVSELFPICRSVTGEGVRETLRVLQREVPLLLQEVPTGTKVFDWTIPREWSIRDAYIRNEAGERVVDFRCNNLHVLNYSAPVHVFLPLAELRKHIFTLPDQPDLIPYRKSFFEEAWGFCMTHDQLTALPEGIYEAVIEASHEDGSLTYGEYLHRGELADEVLLSAHICHPSLANDNCSGLALLALLAKRLAGMRTRYSYRFVFAPGTIGAIAWLARNPLAVSRIRHGLVVTCVGDGGGPVYKRSRRGDAMIDRAAAHVLAHSDLKPQILDFEPVGYDERQYCSPGFNLPVGVFQRSLFGTFPQYHTSADNLDFVRPEYLAVSFGIIRDILDLLETDFRPLSTIRHGEPQLGRHGLYEVTSNGGPGAPSNLAMLWILNFADGEHSLLDIAERAKLPFATLSAAARRLQEHGMLLR